MLTLRINSVGKTIPWMEPRWIRKIIRCSGGIAPLAFVTPIKQLLLFFILSSKHATIRIYRWFFLQNHSVLAWLPIATTSNSRFFPSARNLMWRRCSAGRKPRLSLKRMDKPPPTTGGSILISSLAARPWNCWQCGWEWKMNMDIMMHILHIHITYAYFRELSC